MDAPAHHSQTAAVGKGVGQMIKEAIKDVGDAAKGIVGDGAGEFKVGFLKRMCQARVGAGGADAPALLYFMSCRAQAQLL
jgi:hypothetical protein